MNTTMKITDWADYITGKKFIGDPVKPSIYMKDANLTLCKMLTLNESSNRHFKLCENWKDFYKSEPDIAEAIDPKDRMEAFYANKNGCYCKEVPAFCIYMIRKAYEEYRMPNLILKQMPVNVLKSWFAPGYFSDGITLRDVICSETLGSYEPLSEYKLSCKHSTFTEIYIAETDMVAAIPNDIIRFLDDESIRSITVTPAGLSTHEHLLRTMGTHYGVTNSTYDLRQLI